MYSITLSMNPLACNIQNVMLYTQLWDLAIALNPHRNKDITCQISRITMASGHWSYRRIYYTVYCHSDPVHFVQYMHCCGKAEKVRINAKWQCKRCVLCCTYVLYSLCMCVWSVCVCVYVCVRVCVAMGCVCMVCAWMVCVWCACLCEVCVQYALFSSAAENATGLPVHVYDTVSNVTPEVQFQANPSYTPIVQSLQTPTGTVSMQANPSYITISGLTEA